MSHLCSQQNIVVPTAPNAFLCAKVGAAFQVACLRGSV